LVELKSNPATGLQKNIGMKNISRMMIFVDWKI
jgi:hypothetical protein